jgi:hypothetical protein
MSLSLWVFRKEWLFVNRQNEKSDAPAGTTLSAKPHRALRSLSSVALSSTVSKSDSSVSPQCPAVNVQLSRLGVFILRVATVQPRRRRAFNSCAVITNQTRDASDRKQQHAAAPLVRKVQKKNSLRFSVDGDD